MPGLILRPSNEKIVVKILGLDSVKILFCIKRNSPMEKLFNKYYLVSHETSNSIEFTFRGQIIHEKDTSILLDIEHEDEIVVNRKRNNL